MNLFHDKIVLINLPYITKVIENHNFSWVHLGTMVLSKALSSKLVIEFSIKIQVGTSFLQKYKFDSYAIFLYRFWVSEIGHFWIFCIYGLFGTGFFNPKTSIFDPKTGFFDPKHLFSEYFEYSVVFCKILIIQL